MAEILRRLGTADLLLVAAHASFSSTGLGTCKGFSSWLAWVETLCLLE
jgi:hypothetical protein